MRTKEAASLTPGWVRCAEDRRRRDFARLLNHVQNFADLIRYDDAMIVRFRGSTNDIDDLHELLTELTARYVYDLPGTN